MLQSGGGYRAPVLIVHTCCHLVTHGLANFVMKQQPGPQLLPLDPLLRFLQVLGLLQMKLMAKTLAASSSPPGVEAGHSERQMWVPICVGSFQFVPTCSSLSLLFFISYLALYSNSWPQWASETSGPHQIWQCIF